MNENNIQAYAVDDGEFIPVTIERLELDDRQALVRAVEGKPFVHWVGGYGHQNTAYRFVGLQCLVGLDFLPLSITYALGIPVEFHTQTVAPIESV